MRFTMFFSKDFLSENNITLSKVIATEDEKTFTMHFKFKQVLSVNLFEEFQKGLAKLERELRRYKVICQYEYDDFVCLLSYGKIGQSLSPSEIIGDKGSVLIDKIGLYSGAFKSNGDSKESLTEFVEKPILMSKEASAFADFIKGENLEEYHKNSALCYDVHTCMDLIKQSAEIKYPL